MLAEIYDNHNLWQVNGSQSPGVITCHLEVLIMGAGMDYRRRSIFYFFVVLTFRGFRSWRFVTWDSGCKFNFFGVAFWGYVSADMFLA